MYNATFIYNQNPTVAENTLLQINIRM